MYYVWERGEYIHLHGGEFDSDEAAVAEGMRLSGGSPATERPASLDPPHLHVIRDDGVHILTLEIPNAA
jgi:hypothetical protein